MQMKPIFGANKQLTLNAFHTFFNPRDYEVTRIATSFRTPEVQPG